MPDGTITTMETPSEEKQVQRQDKGGDKEPVCCRVYRGLSSLGFSAQRGDMRVKPSAQSSHVQNGAFKLLSVRVACGLISSWVVPCSPLVKGGEDRSPV